MVKAKYLMLLRTRIHIELLLKSNFTPCYPNTVRQKPNNEFSVKCESVLCLS